MSTPRYVISTTFRGRTKTETWDADSPLMLGRTERGPLWVVENTSEGKVRVRSLASKRGEISNAHSHILEADQIAKGVQVKFKKKDSDEIKFEIRSMRELHPKFYREIGGAGFGRGFLVYHCVGDWNTESTRHQNKYEAKLFGTPVFSIRIEGERAVLTSSRDGLSVEFNGHAKAIDSGKSFEFSSTEFFKTSVRFGHASWYFAVPSEVKKDVAFGIPDHPYANREFYRYAASVAISMMLFLGIIGLLPKPEKEEVIPPQILKVLVQKKKKGAKQEQPTDKPRVNEEQKLAGEKTESREKALAQNPDPTPPKPANELVVPKGAAGGRKTAQRPVPQKVNRAANLYQGLMRGGLMKMLDSKALLDTAKLGAGGAIKGNSKSVANALSNIAMDMNAGSGTSNAKVVGFGGDSSAGVRGPAQIGYSDGVKGAMTAGGGGQGISLGTGDAEVEEGLTKEEVGRVIHAHMKEVRYCYESSMVRASKVDGRVVLDFTINGRGVVSKVRVSNSSLPDPALGECIMRRLRTWQFPNPKGGVNVDVAYPFIFKTLGG